MLQKKNVWVQLFSLVLMMVNSKAQQPVDIYIMMSIDKLPVYWD